MIRCAVVELLVVEAISYGLNIALWLNRNFAFEKLIYFDLAKFEEMKAVQKCN